MLQRLVASFCRFPGVKSAILLDGNGLYHAGVVSSGESSPSVEPASETLSRAKIIAKEHNLGNFDQLWVETQNSKTLLAHVGNKYSLVLTCDSMPNIGRLRHEVDRTKVVFSQLL